MPMLPGKSQSTISKNISEFHGGPTYEHTKEKFGKGTADKQAIAAAMHSAGKSKDPKHDDHKDAVSKMHHEYVHKLVHHALSGKAGSEAQQLAQKAMETHMEENGQSQDPQQVASPTPAINKASMFSTAGPSDQGADDGQQMASPAPKSSMFQRRRGGM